ncbi:MAG: hypothetical protein IPK13_20010 [Deltaproteobacteria bacterium]|nr:hypothetical protein [Deltaproteobacteria bacterium]
MAHLHHAHDRRTLASAAFVLIGIATVGCGSSPPRDVLPRDGNVLVGEGGVDDDASGSDGHDGGLGHVDAQLGDVSLADADPADGQVGDAPGADAAGHSDAADASSVGTCDEPPSLGLTPDFALDPRAEAYWGRVVEVQGIPRAGTSTCSGAETGTSDAGCREGCQADVYVDGKLRLLTSSCVSAKLGCFGNECGLTCTPPLLGLRQRFIGVLDGASSPTTVLRLLRIEP